MDGRSTSSVIPRHFILPSRPRILGSTHLVEVLVWICRMSEAAWNEDMADIAWVHEGGLTEQ